MNTPIVEGVNTSETGDETHSLSGQEREDVNGATNYSSDTVMSKELARQIKATTDSLTRQLERLCDFLKELKQDPSKPNEENSRIF